MSQSPSPAKPENSGPCISEPEQACHFKRINPNPPLAGFDEVERNLSWALDCAVCLKARLEEVIDLYRSIRHSQEELDED